MEQHNRLKDRVENYEAFTIQEKECYFLNLKRLHTNSEYEEIMCAIIQREYDHLKGEADAIKEELIGKTKQKIKILETDWRKREDSYKHQVDLDSNENKGLPSKYRFYLNTFGISSLVTNYIQYIIYCIQYAVYTFVVNKPQYFENNNKISLQN